MESSAEQTTTNDSLYQKDFYAWTQEQARLLKLDDLSTSGIDFKHIAEELDDLARNELTALKSAIKQALLHQAKLTYSLSDTLRAQWNAVLVEQREAISDRLQASPSLKLVLEPSFVEAWAGARKIAIAELAVHYETPTIPVDCPFFLNELIDF